MKLRIIVFDPTDGERRYWFDTPAEVTIGRSRACTCCIEHDSMVSRMHAVLLVDPPSIRIKDLNSTNGLAINGEIYGGVDNEKLFNARELRQGDRVTVGNTILYITLVDDSDDPDGSSEPDTEIKREKQKHAAASGDGPALVTSAIGDRRFTTSQIGRREAGTGNVLADEPVAVPGFEIRECIGSGRIGHVHAAVNLATGETVALKIVSPGLPINRKMVDIFLAGIDSIKTLLHSCLIRYIAAGEVGEDSLFLVTELADGETLSTYLERFPGKRLSPDDACDLVMRICTGLAYAHQHGVVHCDLRPGKIFVSHDANQVRIADLGLVRIMEQAGLPVVGFDATDRENMAYMAPECLHALREVKAAADVFGVGALFYELLTGRRPFNFRAGVSPETTVANVDITPMDERRDDVPESMVAVIERCLMADPGHRYRDCGELLDALENVPVSHPG